MKQNCFFAEIIFLPSTIQNVTLCNKRVKRTSKLRRKRESITTRANKMKLSCISLKEKQWIVHYYVSRIFLIFDPPPLRQTMLATVPLACWRQILTPVTPLVFKRSESEGRVKRKNFDLWGQCFCCFYLAKFR